MSTHNHTHTHTHLLKTCRVDPFAFSASSACSVDPCEGRLMPVATSIQFHDATCSCRIESGAHFGCSLQQPRMRKQGGGTLGRNLARDRLSPRCFCSAVALISESTMSGDISSLDPTRSQV